MPSDSDVSRRLGRRAAVRVGRVLVAAAVAATTFPAVASAEIIELGQTTTFTLDAPLRVKPNNVVALTVPTWAPAFAINQSANTKWVASRKRGKCNETADILAGTPQDTPGSQRAFGCTYNTARLLYSATVVADPNQKPAAPPKKKK